MIRRRVLVHGGVQGVGFRYLTRSRAEEIGVHGWVRNTPDGSVEVEIEGEPDAVEQMLVWLRRGPPGATVTGTDVAELGAQGAHGFTISR